MDSLYIPVLCACCTKRVHHKVMCCKMEFAAHNSLTQFLRSRAAPATNFSDAETASVFTGLSSAIFLHTKFHHDEMHILEYLLLLKYPLKKRAQPPARTTERPRHTRRLYIAFASLIHRFFIAYGLPLVVYLAIPRPAGCQLPGPGPAD